MYTVGITLSHIRELSDRAAERCIEALLDALGVVDYEYLKPRARIVPPLYRSGVRYRDNGFEDIDRWRDIDTVLRAGFGSCAELVPWRLAELWLQGIPARSIAHLQRLDDGGLLFHASIRVRGNKTEDPSERLGMAT